MMLVSLPVNAWAKAVVHTIPFTIAGISAYVNDKVIRSRSFRHIEILFERTVQFDWLSGQYLNFDKSMGLCTYRDGENKLKPLTDEGPPLLILTTAQTLVSLFSPALHPRHSIAIHKRYK